MIGMENYVKMLPKEEFPHVTSPSGREIIWIDRELKKCYGMSPIPYIYISQLRARKKVLVRYMELYLRKNGGGNAGRM